VSKATLVRKPTRFSVSAAPCQCRFLEEASVEPASPIVFDEKMNEYHIERVAKGRRGHYVIYHCPFCGGAAPRSRRHTFFATITSAEEERLFTLTSGLKSFEDVVAKLGKPDSDLDPGVQTPAPTRRPPRCLATES